MVQNMLSADYFILILASFLIMGVITTKLSSRFGVPALILFILLGMIAGSDGLGLIYFDNASHAQLIGIIALVIILFEGGLSTKWTTIKPIAAPSLVLATVGVLITTFIVAIAATFVLDVTWLEGLLFGAIVGSTDAAAVFAALKEQNIKSRIGATLEAESGTNDPMAMFLTLAFIELIIMDQKGIWHIVGAFFLQMGFGLLLGLGMGWIASWIINRINLDSGGLYPIIAMGFALLTYSLTASVGGSGLLAVYVAAMLIGNSDLTYRHTIFRFNEGFAWMMQILMFIILGLLVFPGQLFTGAIILNGLLLSFILILIARPLAVLLSTIGFGYTWKEKTLLSWAGLRGAVPIVLATFPMIAGVENAQLFFNVVFFVVLTSALIQGSTISVFANKLGLTGPKKVTPLHSLELVSIGQANAEIVEYVVNEETKIVGQNLTEIEFPNDVLINAIIRKGELVTPYGETVIYENDILYILVSRKSKKELKKLLGERKSVAED
ncbi:potassium/proton antiporter [Salipaludibacillus neizhouensis]|uniref:Potassium/proton antiporter n=1 Tax=Salipaludibacillus neizhouensis TaxID=885475 RepID=A0A3A9KLB4_9BACI|nr:potassium/proton antiporter [Salipaludibacillus neizhouensis]RKL68625.1 potassium/proton antiporter [Salipaludibacillus neizhouensis]